MAGPMPAAVTPPLAALTAYGWEPGPGDPSFAGWAIFTSYLVVAFFLWRTGRSEKSRGQNPLLWYQLAGGCLFLALNKQLDLHNAVTAIGRNLARQEGWYENRRAVQLVFIVFLLAGLAGAVWWTLRHLGSGWKRHRLTLAGMLVLFGFIALRAASFHHLDSALRVEFATVRLHAVIELTGIWLLFFAARRTARQPVIIPPVRGKRG
jgi:hypothetical protein